MFRAGFRQNQVAGAGKARGAAAWQSTQPIFIGRPGHAYLILPDASADPGAILDCAIVPDGASAVVPPCERYALEPVL